MTSPRNLFGAAVLAYCFFLVIQFLPLAIEAIGWPLAGYPGNITDVEGGQ